MTEQQIFWGLYEQYVQTANPAAKTKLAERLPSMEVERLNRPEKGWDLPLAYEVLVGTSVVIRDYSFQIFEGEIIIEDHYYDREMYVTRTPRLEFITGTGVLYNNEPKILLPLYEPEIIQFKIMSAFAKFRAAANDFLEGSYEYWKKSGKNIPA